MTIIVSHSSSTPGRWRISFTPLLLLICIVLVLLINASNADDHEGPSTCKADLDKSLCEEPTTKEQQGNNKGPIQQLQPPRQLVICSHNRVFVHDIDTGKHRTIHSGQGVYYSFVSFDDKSIWVSKRGASDTHPDMLMELELGSPEQNVRSQMVLQHSHFTHETVRVKDRLYVADTSSGAINVLPFPPEQKLLKRVEKYSRRHHLNSLAPVDEDGKRVWAMFHNQSASSFVALLDLETMEVVQQIDNIGNQAHSWLEYPAYSTRRLYLSSGDASLIMYDLNSHERMVLYTSKRHLNPKRMFLKGLAVLNDVAYFGESEWRDRAGRASVPCHLIAFDLRTRKVLFERVMPGSIGLINTISVPTKDFSSTYRAVTSSQVTFLDATTKCRSLSRTPLLVEQHRIIADARISGFAYGSFPDDVDIVRLPLNFPLEALQQEVDNLVANHGGWVSRPDVNNYFVLLITKEGIADDQSNVGPFAEVPGRLEQSPAMRQLIRSLGIVAGRSRLMMLKPGENVKSHFDRTNHFRTGPDGKPFPDVNAGYWGRRYRVHVPIYTDPAVKFRVGETELHLEAGGVYIFDNAKMHSVENKWTKNRVHLVVDTVGGPRLLNMILRDSRTQFFPSRPQRFLDILKPASDSSTSLFPQLDDPDQENGIMIEKWIDAPVFQPMSANVIAGYLSNHVLKDFVKPEHQEYVKGLFDSFIRVWHAIPSELLDVSHDLLEPAMCFEGVLRNGQSLLEAVEPLARMLFYQCHGMPTTIQDSSIGPPCTAVRRRPT